MRKFFFYSNLIQNKHQMRLISADCVKRQTASVLPVFLPQKKKAAINSHQISPANQQFISPSRGGGETKFTTQSFPPSKLSQFSSLSRISGLEHNFPPFL
uniref:(northern house mosquito) hypothetical protein n=1 Tax=Culex pipiens TaxID=7175 RepID=A0A8D8BRG0_CULPI